MTDVVRTPEDRFLDLPGWPYPPRYSDVAGLRLARVDEGPEDGRPVVLLHGEPTWGYLYRKLVPPLLDAGLRVVVPDQVGFGRSDKPTDRDWFTYDRLTASFTGHLEAVVPDVAVTLVVHDWGGPVGLRWAVEHPERVARLVILDTGLYVSGGRMSDAWRRFRDFVAQADELPVGELVRGGCATGLADEVVAAYQAPFHEPAAQAGALSLPLLVPTGDDAPGADAMASVMRQLGEWRRPTLVLWGADDPILPVRIGERFVEHIPGALDLETFTPAAHFLQEDVGGDLGARIGRFVTEGA